MSTSCVIDPVFVIVGQSSENEDTLVPHAPFAPSDGDSGRRSSCGSAQSANRRSMVPPQRGSPLG